MKTLKSPQFWLGVAVGAVVVPIVLTKYAPGLKARIPGSGGGTQSAPQ